MAASNKKDLPVAIDIYKCDAGVIANRGAMNEKEELAAKLRRLEEANIGLAMKNRQLEEQLAAATDEARELKETINRAKDIRPWQRPNFRNVKQLAKRAFLDVVKVASGWQVKMGATLGRTFKTLREIWLILTREDWNLHDEFLPYDELLPQPQPVAQPQLPVAQPQLPVAQPQLSDDTPIGNWGTLGKLKSEWRNFPSSRNAIAELFTRQGLDLALLTGAT